MLTLQELLNAEHVQNLLTKVNNSQSVGKWLVGRWLSGKWSVGCGWFNKTRLEHIFRI